MTEDGLPAILLVDDEKAFLDAASFTLKREGLARPVPCQDPAKALALLGEGGLDAVLLDIMMPGMDGRELLSAIAAGHPGVPVVMLTALGDAETVVDCMRRGAFDYLVKPVDKLRLLTTLGRALEHGRVLRENRCLCSAVTAAGPSDPRPFAALLGGSSALLSVFKVLEAVAPGAQPVLIQGETGTGKDLAAQALHAASRRRGPFVAVNAAGLDDAMLSDTLFGHVRGAFTGAEARREGLVAKAAGGTLFLDEIGDLKPESQVKLLRLLEDGAYYPVGADVPARSAARVVAATHADLRRAVERGAFRQDLYWRLTQHTVRLPPLRQRPEDLGLLARHFIGVAAAELGKAVPTAPPELEGLLKAHDFPGNVRELKAMAYEAVGRHQGGVLSLAAFRERMDPGAKPAPPSWSWPEALPTLEAASESLINEAMRRAGGNQSQAALLLGMTRSALNKRLNRP